MSTSARNKTYYDAARDIFEQKAVPVLEAQGFERNPWGPFRQSAQGYTWTLMRLDSDAFERLDASLIRHWSGYDDRPSFQLEYLPGRHPFGSSQGARDRSDFLQLIVRDGENYRKRESLEDSRRWFGLGFSRRYGFRGSDRPELLQLRVARFEKALTDRLGDMASVKCNWQTIHGSPVMMPLPSVSPGNPV